MSSEMENRLYISRGQDRCAGIGEMMEWGYEVLRGDGRC